MLICMRILLELWSRVILMELHYMEYTFYLPHLWFHAIFQFRQVDSRLLIDQVDCDS